MARANLLWVLLVVQWSSNSHLYALVTKPASPEKDFWNSYKEAVSRLGGVGLRPLRSDLDAPERNADTFTQNFDEQPYKLRSEVRKNIPSSNKKVSTLIGNENASDFSSTGSVDAGNSSQTTKQGNFRDEDTDLTTLPEPRMTFNMGLSLSDTKPVESSDDLENVTLGVDTISSFGSAPSAQSLETKVTDFLRRDTSAAPVTDLPYAPPAAGADGSDVTSRDEFDLKSTLPGGSPAPSRVQESQDEGVLMTYPQHPRNDQLSPAGDAQVGGAEDKSSEILSAIISTVLRLSGNRSQEELWDHQSSFIPYKYAQDLSVSGGRPEENSVNEPFSQVKSDPLKTPLIQFYKESSSGDKVNGSDQNITFPMKLNSFFLGNKFNLANRIRTSTFSPIFMRDSAHNASTDTSFHLITDFTSLRPVNNTGFNISLHSDEIKALNNSVVLSSADKTTANTSVTTLPPVRKAPPTPVRRVVVPAAPATVGSVVVNHPAPAPEEPNIRHEGPTSQFDALVRVVQHPSLLTAGLLNVASTVGLFGGIVSLPFLLPLAGGRRRRSLLDRRYAVIDHKFRNGNKGINEIKVGNNLDSILW